MDSKKIVILSDLQQPFTDKKSLAAVEHFMVDVRPDEIIYDGDIVDFPTLSDHAQDPGLSKGQLLDTIETVCDMFRRHQALFTGDQPVYRWLAGNHEDRLRRFLWTRARELWGVDSLTIPSLFHLDRHEAPIPFTEYDEGVVIRDVFQIVHGTIVRKHSGDSARAMFDKYHMSGVSGHTHRLGTYYKRAWKETYVWAENGCLCDINPRAAWSKHWARFPDWQQGFTMVTFPGPGKRFFLEQFPIVNHKFVYGGKVYD